MPAGALARAVDGWRALGFEPQLGFELELYVLEPDESAVGGWRPAGGPGHRVYGVGLGGDPTGLALEFFDVVEAMDIGLEGVLTEFSPGQMEINLTYGPALAAADSAHAGQGDDPRGGRPAGLPGDVHGPARTPLSVGLGAARQLLGGAGVGWGQRVRTTRRSRRG